MRKQREALIQQAIFIWFNNNYRKYIIHSVPNGISFNLPKKEVKRVLNSLSLIGMVAGVSDLIIHLENGKCLMVEVKNENGKQSKEQLKIQEKIELLGGNYILVRSLDEFKEKIIQFINNYTNA